MFKVLILLLLSFNVLAGEIQGVVTRVIDGDTVILGTGGTKLKVRLQGIDAPERRQAHGGESTRYLEDIVLNRQVIIKYKDSKRYDRYKRNLGTIFLNGQDINLSMINAGMAWDSPRYSKSQSYGRAQHEARIQRIGLWQNTNAVAPWVYRAKKRRRSR